MFLLPAKVKGPEKNDKETQLEEDSRPVVVDGKPDLAALSIRVARLDAAVSIAARRSTEVEEELMAGADQYLKGKMQQLERHLQDHVDARVESLVQKFCTEQLLLYQASVAEAAPKEAEQGSLKTKTPLRKSASSKRTRQSKLHVQTQMDAGSAPCTAAAQETPADIPLRNEENAIAVQPKLPARKRAVSKRRPSDSSGHSESSSGLAAHCRLAAEQLQMQTETSDACAPGAALGDDLPVCKVRSAACRRPMRRKHQSKEEPHELVPESSERLLRSTSGSAVLQFVHLQSGDRQQDLVDRLASPREAAYAT